MVLSVVCVSPNTESRLESTWWYFLLRWVHMSHLSQMFHNICNNVELLSSHWIWKECVGFGLSTHCIAYVGFYRTAIQCCVGGNNYDSNPNCDHDVYSDRISMYPNIVSLHGMNSLCGRVFCGPCASRFKHKISFSAWTIDTILILAYLLNRIELKTFQFAMIKLNFDLAHFATHEKNRKRIETPLSNLNETRALASRKKSTWRMTTTIYPISSAIYCKIEYLFKKTYHIISLKWALCTRIRQNKLLWL